MEAENEALQMSTDFSENWVNEYIQNIEEKITVYVDEVDTLFEST